VTHRNLREVVLDDGIYELPVSYVSHTGTRANYTLDIKIQSDQIVCIYFGNGGYVHTGYNNSGYVWSGGGIQWDVDYYNGDIRGGKAIVQISYGSGEWQLFTIYF
jgi:hypothetical protein